MTPATLCSQPSTPPAPWEALRAANEVPVAVKSSKALAYYKKMSSKKLAIDGGRNSIDGDGGGNKPLRRLRCTSPCAAPAPRLNPPWWWDRR